MCIAKIAKELLEVMLVWVRVAIQAEKIDNGPIVIVERGGSSVKRERRPIGVLVGV